MYRWTLRFCLAGCMAGGSLMSCGSSTSDDGGTDVGHGGQSDADPIQAKDSGPPDHFLIPDLLPLPDAGSGLGSVPTCAPSVQRGVPCAPGPNSACLPASGQVVCLCPTGTWVCF